MEQSKIRPTDCSDSKICRVSTIYSDDRNLEAFATSQGISVMVVGQLPLPPEEAQMDFVWNMVNEDDDQDVEVEI